MTAVGLKLLNMVDFFSNYNKGKIALREYIGVSLQADQEREALATRGLITKYLIAPGLRWTIRHKGGVVHKSFLIAARMARWISTGGM